MHLQGKQCSLEGGFSIGLPGGCLDGIKGLELYQLSDSILAGMSGLMVSFSGSAVFLLGDYIKLARAWELPYTGG